MTLILEDSASMPFHTDMKTLIAPFISGFEKLNWLITDLQFMLLDGDEPAGHLTHEKPAILLSGKELTEIICTRNIQFIWAVFSGFTHPVPALKEHELPYADGNEKIWRDPGTLQLAEAEMEIICWDSSATIIKFRNQDLAGRFMSAFPDAKILKPQSLD